MRNPRVLIVVIALSVAVGCDRGVAGDAPSSSVGVARGVFVYDEEGATVGPGTYRIPASEWSVADFEVTFGEGWTVQYGHVFHRPSASQFGLEFYAVVPDAIYADACDGDSGDLSAIGPGVDDLASALLQQPGANAGPPVSTTVGGYPATRIDLAIAKSTDLGECSLGDIGLQIWYSPTADKYFVLLADNPTSVYIVDVDGRRQAFIAGPVGASTTEEDAAELQAVLDSIRIEP